MTTALVFALTLGCGEEKEQGWNPFLSSDGTGVRGLDTPDQILSNPYVEEALNEASDIGVNFTPETGVNPPVISGTYHFTGQVYYEGQSGWHTLSPGTWKWFNQTADNHIETAYDQIDQSGGGGGEIIRGSGNRFTVYSVLEIEDFACTERAVAIVDGEQDSNGNVRAVYLITPAQKPICHVTTIGRLELTLTGTARNIRTPDGYSLLLGTIKNNLIRSKEQDWAKSSL